MISVFKNTIFNNQGDKQNIFYLPMAFNKHMIRHKISIIVLLVTYILFLNSTAQALGLNVSQKIESLIYERIRDNDITIDLQYQSNSIINKINSRSNEIKDIILTEFDANRAYFKVKISYNNEEEEIVVGQYISFLEVPVTTKVIRAGETISSTDINTVRININKIRNNYATKIYDVVGMQAKKQIASGALIKNHELMKPIVIKHSDPVSIIYHSNNIKLKTSGISLGSGAIGDIIKVKNEDTRMVLLGEIINKNTIQVGNNE